MKEMESNTDPVSLKGIMLNKNNRKIMFEVINLLKTKGISVHDASEILEAASCEIQAVVMHRNI